MEFKKILLFIVIGLLVADFVWNRVQNDSLKRELKMQDQNRAALMDTLRETREGEKRVYSKLLMGYTKVKDLREQMPQLWNEIKGLKNRKSITNVTNVTNYYEAPRRDSVPTTIEKIDSNTYVIRWEYKDSTRQLAGETKLNLEGDKITKILDGDTITYYKEGTLEINPVNTSITKDQIELAITVGVRRRGKYDEIFVIPPKNVTITNIEGGKYYRKEKKWGLGVYTGYGVNYNPVRKRFGHGVQIGVGVQYNFLRW